MAKILLVEDIANNANIVRKIVESLGHDFHWAENAETGLNLALDIQPDLILLDLGLPDVDGQTLSIWLRGEMSLMRIPLIAMTAWPEETARMMVKAYNLDGYIGKPFRMQDLIALIEKHLTPSQES